MISENGVVMPDGPRWVKSPSGRHEFYRANGHMWEKPTYFIRKRTRTAWQVFTQLHWENPVTKCEQRTLKQAKAWVEAVSALEA